MFESLQDGLKSAFKSLRGKGKLTEANMRDGLKMVEQSLLEADVSYSVVQDFMGRVTEQALGESVLLSLKPHEQLVGIVNQELIDLLGPVDEFVAPAKGCHRHHDVWLAGFRENDDLRQTCQVVDAQQRQPDVGGG